MEYTIAGTTLKANTFNLTFPNCRRISLGPCIRIEIKHNAIFTHSVAATTPKLETFADMNFFVNRGCAPY
jgi:hypothetical protein